MLLRESKMWMRSNSRRKIGAGYVLLLLVCGLRWPQAGNLRYGWLVGQKQRHGTCLANCIRPSLLKLMQTNACHYACSFRFTSCAIKRTSFKPDELATTICCSRCSSAGIARKQGGRHGCRLRAAVSTKPDHRAYPETSVVEPRALPGTHPRLKLSFDLEHWILTNEIVP